MREPQEGLRTRKYLMRDKVQTLLVMANVSGFERMRDKYPEVEKQYLYDGWTPKKLGFRRIR